MDTLTHALSGALAGRLFARSRAGAAASPLPAWQAVIAGAAAAAFPDLDFVLGYVSELTYLRGHRGITHSVILLPLWALLLAWLLARLFGAEARERGGWRALYPVACAALLLHIAGDLITQFGTMILAPLSDRRYGFGTTFIIDLGVSGILVAGLLASALWRRSRVPAGIAFVALAGWIGLGAIGRGEAIDAARAYASANGIPVVALDAAPRPASPFNWTAIVFDGERYHYAHLNTRRSEPLVATASDHFIRRFSSPYLPVAMARWEVRPKFGTSDVQALARAVWDAEDFSFFRRFAMFPVLDHAEADGSPASGCAGFRDLRFETPGRDALPFRYGLCGGAGPGWRLYELEAGVRRWMATD